MSCEIEPRWEIGNFIFVVNVGVGVTLCADTSLIIKTRREVFLFLEQKLETETTRCDSARRDPSQPNHNHLPVQIETISSSTGYLDLITEKDKPYKLFHRDHHFPNTFPNIYIYLYITFYKSDPT